MRKRAVGIGLAAALMATAALTAPVAAAPHCGAGAETIRFTTLKVEAAPDKKSYRVGQTAKINVLVTRPAEEDPLGQGIPTPRPTTQPAEGVNVGVGLRIGDVFLPGFALTDAEGKALVQIRIAEYAPAEEANASVFAYRVVADATCVLVEEGGYTYRAAMFMVRRG